MRCSVPALRDLVPVDVKRPAVTSEAHGPAPLVSARRTTAARVEGVPRHPTALERRLRRPGAVETTPAARRRRPPFAVRTPNAGGSVVELTLDLDSGRHPNQR